MAFSLKPSDLENAKSADDVRKKSKADLKNCAGKKNVKFIAVNKCMIGGKSNEFFIVTNEPADFEEVLKKKYSSAKRAKGTCDVILDESSGKTKVSIRSAVGQIDPVEVALMIPKAVGSKKNVIADYPGSPLLKTVEKPKDKGVPEWAQEDYRRDAARTLIASMTSDGKIGSVYFEGEGRIRTTHVAGPTKESSNEITVQFNVNDDSAQQAFFQKYPKMKGEKGDVFWGAYDNWMLRELHHATAESLPSWAKLISSPKDAHNLKEGRPTGQLTLVELFKSINGKLEGWHPSRGTATQFDTDKQTISVLEAAIQHISSLDDPHERNVAFYAFVKSRLPNFISFIRDPSDIE